MPAAIIPDRAIVRVTGPDAEHFLQNILTLDLDLVQQGEVRAGALLTPQGKILFDFLISRVEGGFRLECQADIAADFAKRLMLYRLRAKAEISTDEEIVVAASWGDDVAASEADDGSLRDSRFAGGNVRRIYGSSSGATATLDAWTAFRVSQGVAESGSDYALADAFPHDVLLDQNAGVGFRKGCYIGQEVVSRMQHRGTARRRMLIVQADTPLPPFDTPLTVDGKPVGAMGSSSGSNGLALVRIDKVKDAMDRGAAILAGDVPVTLEIPAWAKFQFPEKPGAEA